MLSLTSLRSRYSWKPSCISPMKIVAQMFPSELQMSATPGEYGVVRTVRLRMPTSTKLRVSHSDKKMKPKSTISYNIILGLQSTQSQRMTKKTKTHSLIGNTFQWWIISKIQTSGYVSKIRKVCLISNILHLATF